jgi:hypothetical protein
MKIIIRRNVFTGSLILLVVFSLVLFCDSSQVTAESNLDSSQVTAESNLSTNMKAAEQGDAEALYYLGSLYVSGDGVLHDDKQAFEWIRKAANQGLAGAQALLGLMYVKGKGVPQDDKQAGEWYKKAVEQGNVGAQALLVIMHVEDKDIALCDKKAIEQSEADAQTLLGIMYSEGIGVHQDDKQAVEWYKKAAEQGYARAQTLLGTMYYKGEGVPQDDIQAAEWFKKAAEKGDAEAQDYLKAPEKARLIKEARETQQALHEIFKNDKPLSPDLDELISAREFKSSFDLIRSFSSTVKNLDDEHVANGDTLDLTTAKHLAIALHAWAFWYEEVLGIPELQIPYWPMAVITDRPRIHSNAYGQFSKWRAKLRDVERKARRLCEETEDPASIKKAKKPLIIGGVVGGGVMIGQQNKKFVATLDAATNLYEINGLITEDIPVEWERMLLDYIAIEDGFYEMVDGCKIGASVDGQKAGAILDKIIAHYAKAKDYEANRESLALLRDYQVLARRYFREVQKLARHEILDIPTTDLSYYWYLKFKRSTTNWDFYMNKIPFFNEEAQKAQKMDMRSAALGFSTVNELQAHCVFDFEKSALIRWTGCIKEKYSKEEYEQLVSEAKQKAQWYKLAHRLTEPVAPGDGR